MVALAIPEICSWHIWQSDHKICGEKVFQHSYNWLHMLNYLKYFVKTLSINFKGILIFCFELKCGFGILGILSSTNHQLTANFLKNPKVYNPVSTIHFLKPTKTQDLPISFQNIFFIYLSPKFSSDIHDISLKFLAKALTILPCVT